VLKSFVLKIKRGSGGRAPSRWRPLGVEGRSPRRCDDFTAFFQKIRIFRHTRTLV